MVPNEIWPQTGLYPFPICIQFILKWFDDKNEEEGFGVEVDGLMVALLLCADDLAESEKDLQDMLNVLHE